MRGTGTKHPLFSYPSIPHPESCTLKRMTILSSSPRVVRPRFDSPAATWQDAMKNAVRDVAELCRLLDLPADFAAGAVAAAGQFPLFVPRGFVARMRPGDAHDPLLRQV